MAAKEIMRVGLSGVLLVSLSAALAQEKDGQEAMPIPSIPRVPSLRETAPARPVGPQTLGPGLSLPGLGIAVPVKPERLHPEFQLGNTYRFVVKTEFQTRTAEGLPGGFSMEQQARFDARVRLDGKLGIVLFGRTERLDLILNQGATTLTYRSLAPEDQDTPLARHVKASLNRSVEMALDPKGHVETSHESGRGDGVGLLEGVPRLGPDELVQLVAGLPQSFSEKRVAPGDGWSRQGSRRIEGAGDLQFDVAYRYVGPVSFEGNQCLSVEFGGQLSGTFPPEGPNGGAAPGDFQTTAMSGRVYFDPLDRMVRYLEQTVDLWIQPSSTEGDPALQIPLRETTTLRLLHVIPTP
ncbi:MAG TPA: hypothetical protein PLA50_02620 [Bacteroidia bacterium]|nr:hypothetical protein [Bacteroidia bacterium]